ncbi:hypothetical protein B0O99DRAFT_602845 [Bisporella sp. PMI_857]|nr:hypothetical protein B0O99DRAFT_602845 [Bisporella sp. PMI_857]
MCELYENNPDNELTVSLDLLENDSTVKIVRSQVTIDNGSLSTSDISPPSVHFKVSFKHLSLASRWFKIMLSRGWEEAKTVYKDGYCHVTLDYGFDPGAFKLLLDIIHEKTSKVSRSFDLEMLAKVSVLVDDFECYEEVDVFVDIWLDSLPISPLTKYSRDLVLWIFVSFVFRRSELFEFTTRTAILHSTEPIQTFGLPSLAKIDEKRQELLNQLTGTLHDVFDKLRRSQALCGFECDSMLLGAIIKQLYPHYLIWPKPSEPFIGFNFAKSAKTVRSLRSPAWCDMLMRTTATKGSEDEEMHFGTKKKKEKHRSP